MSQNYFKIQKYIKLDNLKKCKNFYIKMILLNGICVTKNRKKE